MTEYYDDARHLVNTVEDVHPIFLARARMLPENYAAAREEFLVTAKNDIDKKDFVFAMHRYVTMLKDGHMSGFFRELKDDKYWPMRFGGFVDIKWTAENERLFLDDGDGEVTQIGGVSVEQVFNAVDTYYYSENEVDREYKYGFFALYSTLLEMAGCDIIDNKVTLDIFKNGVTSRREVLIVDKGLSEIHGNKEYDYIIRHEMVADVFVIDLRQFVLGDHITETAKAIKQAVSGGTRKFIIDLRGNGGGNSGAGEELLKAMGIEVPQLGIKRRVSKLAIEQRPEPWMWSDEVKEMSDLNNKQFVYGVPCVAVKNPNNVRINVLTDKDSYSSSVMLALWVQDGKLGNVIGNPPRNSPSCFGDMLYITLPHSNIIVRVSYSHFMRPDVTADPDTLWPDIICDPADAMVIALEYFNKEEIS